MSRKLPATELLQKYNWEEIAEKCFEKVRLSCRTEEQQWFFCLWHSPTEDKQCAIQVGDICNYRPRLTYCHYYHHFHHHRQHQVNIITCHQPSECHPEKALAASTIPTYIYCHLSPSSTYSTSISSSP